MKPINQLLKTLKEIKEGGRISDYWIPDIKNAIIDYINEESEHEHRYYKNKENAEKKYKKLCKKYGVKPRFCFTDQDGITIGYGEIYFDD